jgi:hypothetical protein
VVHQPGQLEEQHPHQLAAPRHLDAEQLLHRHAEHMLLRHRRRVVEAVEIRNRLQIGLVLDQLLGTAMQEPDMRIGALDHLAVEVEQQAQHAVGRWVLRPEIDGEGAYRSFSHEGPQGGRMANGAWRVANN